MEKFLIPMNWTLGTLLLVVAVVYPVLDNGFFTDGKKSVAERHVAEIAKIETTYYRRNEKYRLFSAGEMPGDIRDQLGLGGLRDRNFVYNALLDEEGVLVIRAQVATEKIKSGSMPPLTYTLRKNMSSGQSTDAWEQLSGKKPGLL